LLLLYISSDKLPEFRRRLFTPSISGIPSIITLWSLLVYEYICLVFRYF
jgi:hypothetical protein